MVVTSSLHNTTSGPKNIADAVRKTAVPFGVSNIAQVAAVASLEHEAELFQRVEEVIAERTWFESELTKLGFKLPRPRCQGELGKPAARLECQKVVGDFGRHAGQEKQRALAGPMRPLRPKNGG